MRQLTFAFVLLLAAVCAAQTSQEPQPIVSFDVTAIDKSMTPCDDFYQFACGSWMKNNPIPGDQSRWGQFAKLADNNLYVLRDLLQKAGQGGANRSAVEQKVGDFYGACMDESVIEKKGYSPIKPDLARIEKVKNKSELISLVAQMHREGMSGLFSFYPFPSFKQGSQMIATVDQGGLTLPDRDYYLKDDPKAVETRQKYQEHVARMLKLIGDKPQAAEANAKTVLAIETELARASMDRTQRRNPHNRDHWMSLTELEKLGPNFQFTRYFESVASPKFTELNVANPEFFKQINAQIDSVPLEQWKTYLRWKTLKNQAPLLSKVFVDENFSWTQYMSGQKELEPRWKRCVEYTDNDLGEALGQLYVDKTFGKEGKERTLKMVQAIEHAMERDINELEWMAPETKKRAMEKLSSIVNNIGYPDKWRDYSSVKVTRDDLNGNDRRATVFESNRQYNKIGKPVDRKEWTMTPPTVNAYYRSANNDINFPAGILQPPFYSNKIDDAVNFGAIGVVIGHELTHGFDDQGRKFDAKGDLKDWWTAEDGKEFEKRAACIDEQYSGYSVDTDKGPEKLNGKLTLGENTADNGGARLAYMALKEIVGDKDPGPIDGYTTDQRFFLGYAQVWCQNVTPQELGVRVKTDPHSPGRYRVNGVVSNSPEFQKAFSCKQGDKMVSQNACRVW